MALSSLESVIQLWRQKLLLLFPIISSADLECIVSNQKEKPWDPSWCLKQERQDINLVYNLWSGLINYQDVKTDQWPDATIKHCKANKAANNKKIGSKLQG